MSEANENGSDQPLEGKAFGDGWESKDGANLLGSEVRGVTKISFVFWVA